VWGWSIDIEEVRIKAWRNFNRHRVEIFPAIFLMFFWHNIPESLIPIEYSYEARVEITGNNNCRTIDLYFKESWLQAFPDHTSSFLSSHPIHSIPPPYRVTHCLSPLSEHTIIQLSFPYRLIGVRADGWPEKLCLLTYSCYWIIVSQPEVKLIAYKRSWA